MTAAKETAGTKSALRKKVLPSRKSSSRNAGYSTCLLYTSITIPYVDHEDEISLKERSEAQNELKNIARLNK